MTVSSAACAQGEVASLREPFTPTSEWNLHSALLIMLMTVLIISYIMK